MYFKSKDNIINVSYKREKKNVVKLPQSVLLVGSSSLHLLKNVCVSV